MKRAALTFVIAFVGTLVGMAILIGTAIAVGAVTWPDLVRTMQSITETTEPYREREWHQWLAMLNDARHVAAVLVLGCALLLGVLMGRAKPTRK
ncbi:MAG: hypothetical protein KBC38_02625 [Candidatus Pacebacteria bacterium]|nr:hypothetical protein [Candidatus Paceibacterota bacterium]MBP9840349.1 hypothetical protein [Candidatus Paceibacterota bacterium]